jgi:hypothetical protein
MKGRRMVLEGLKGEGGFYGLFDVSEVTRGGGKFGILVLGPAI